MACFEALTERLYNTSAMLARFNVISVTARIVPEEEPVSKLQASACSISQLSNVRAHANIIKPRTKIRRSSVRAKCKRMKVRAGKVGHTSLRTTLRFVIQKAEAASASSLAIAAYPSSILVPTARILELNPFGSII